MLLTLSVALALGLLIAVVVPLLASVNSQSFPPHIVQGSASLLGQTVDEGTVVRAWTSVEQVAEAPVDADGNYRLSVPVDASSASQVIGFTVGNYTDWSRVTLAVGGDTTLNLNANGCGQALPGSGATRTASGSLVKTCLLFENSTKYGKWYYFAIPKRTAITISMSTVFSKSLYLR